ncbi:MAG: adenylate kinase [Paludibacteraceae bacterium]|nr:adenylate kinase [Paludibacteraceae bacterium]
MLNIILCGAPGSGKGTQSDFIVEKYGLSHLSTGDVLRAEIKAGTPLGKEIDAIISKGQLVSDDKMIALIEHFLDSLSKDCKGVIFDGFPRTVAQAEALTAMLAKRNMSATLIDLMVEEQSLIERMINRGKTSGRADDNLETIKQRLQVFHRQTAPVADFYLEQRNYFAINGNKSMQQVFAQIDNILQILKH